MRSLIRNDVLYLVALNAAVIHKQGTNSDNGYQEYQEYLQKSNFFEHTIFTEDEYKGFNEVQRRIDSILLSLINTPINETISGYVINWATNGIKNSQRYNIIHYISKPI